MNSILILAALLVSWLQIPGGPWQVDQSTAAAAKSALASRFVTEASNRNDDTPRLDDFTFHFQGQVIDGRRLVYINAFCTAPTEAAATEWVYADDGGSCYFEAFFEPDTGKILSFQFNGVA